MWSWVNTGLQHLYVYIMNESYFLVSVPTHAFQIQLISGVIKKARLFVSYGEAKAEKHLKMH